MNMKSFSQSTRRRSFRMRNIGNLNTKQLQADSWAGRTIIMGKHMVWVRL